MTKSNGRSHDLKRETLRTWVQNSSKKAEDWKKSLAKYVVAHQFIRYGDSILLGSGTTPIYLMDELVNDAVAKGDVLDLAIVTSNLQVLYKVRDAQRSNADILGNWQVLVTGGRLNHSLDSMIGDHAALAIRSDLFNPRLVFVGAAGLSFRHGLNISFQFEEEISTQKAFATRPTTDRILLCDHEKMGRRSFYNLKLSIQELMQDAVNCYVITTCDPQDKELMAVLNEEQAELTKLLAPLADSQWAQNKEFVFRMIRKDSTVEREIRLSKMRDALGNPLAAPGRTETAAEVGTGLAEPSEDAHPPLSRAN